MQPSTDERQNAAVVERRRETGIVVATFASLALLPGCDVLYGIRRSASMEGVPSYSCIESAIRSVEEIDEVRHEVRESGRTLTFTGLQEPDEVHYFHYSSGEVGASLMVLVDHAGDVTFQQHLCRMNRPFPQSEIDAVRPLMIRIEHAIEERCGIPGLTKSVVEWVDAD